MIGILSFLTMRPLKITPPPVGQTLLNLSLKGFTGKVYAFEPELNNYKSLVQKFKKMIMLNVIIVLWVM